MKTKHNQIHWERQGNSESSENNFHMPWNSLSPIYLVNLSFRGQHPSFSSISCKYYRLRPQCCVCFWFGVTRQLSECACVSFHSVSLSKWLNHIWCRTSPQFSSWGFLGCAHTDHRAVNELCWLLTHCETLLPVLTVCPYMESTWNTGHGSHCDLDTYQLHEVQDISINRPWSLH